MRVLLVAKPWKGGLARYLLEALRKRVDTDVQWIATTPSTSRERYHYTRNRRAWRERQLEHINTVDRDVAVFLNLPPHSQDIAYRPGNLLWMTDSACANTRQLTAFSKVFASDPGHAENLASQAGEERFAGVLPFAMNPSTHCQAGERAPVRDVCFIGNRDPKRNPHIEALLSAPCSATVVGNYFLRSALFWRAPHLFRPRVTIEAMAKVYSQHRISLNVHAQVVAAGTNMRTFECAGYGIPQLVENRPGVTQLFEAEREIAIYDEPAELAQALSRLLADPKASAAMAERARHRVLQEHTYAHRIEQMFAVLPPE
jgi:spore maturation protein CgeB